MDILSTTLKKKNLVPKSFFSLPFQKIKQDILGKNYDLSLVLVGKKRIRTLNKKYRNKDYATDVLSFGVDNNVGEVFICPHLAKVKSKKFFDPSSEKHHPKFINYENYLLFLVIHAFLHLKGLEHGSKMSQYELAHYSRYRHRHL